MLRNGQSEMLVEYSVKCIPAATEKKRMGLLAKAPTLSPKDWNAGVYEIEKVEATRRWPLLD